MKTRRDGPEIIGDMGRGFDDIGVKKQKQNEGLQKSGGHTMLSHRSNLP
jgi:hypothetical protein